MIWTSTKNSISIFLTPQAEVSSVAQPEEAMMCGFAPSSSDDVYETADILNLKTLLREALVDVASIDDVVYATSLISD